MPKPDFTMRCRRELEFASRLRIDERYSHVSAARIWGMPLPYGADPRVHLVTGPEDDRRERRGVVSHRRSGDTWHLAGMPISSPVETFIELGTILNRDALVAVGDWMMLTPRHPTPSDRRPYATPESLLEQVTHRRAWGIRTARAAAALTRTGVESPKETELRLLLEAAGFPPPECGVLILDEHGDPIGHFDLVWPDQRVIVEYDGDQHRTDVEQYEKDILRFDRATAAGWRVIRVRSYGLSLAGRAGTISRVRDAFLRMQPHQLGNGSAIRGVGKE